MEVLIIEDEIPAAEKMQKLLLEYDSSVAIVGVLNSIESSVEWLRSNKHPDLILLDIHLADGLCFDIFKEVKVKSPVIFCTAYDQYALKAFELNSIDYLLKPVQAGKLEKSLDKLKDLQQQRQQPVEGDLLNNLMSMIGRKESKYKSRFMVRIGNRIQAVKADDIAYFYSRNKLTLLVTKGGQSFPVDYSLDDLIQLLNPSVFFHVNRSLIIHIDSAREIHPYFKGRLKLVLHPPLDEEVVVSSQRTPVFKDWLDQ